MMYDSMLNIKNLVENVLRDTPIARASDMKLIVEVWKKQGLKLDEEQEKFLLGQCSNPESIRRLRQKFHEEEFYLPSSAIQQERRDEEEKIRIHFSKERSLF